MKKEGIAEDLRINKRDAEVYSKNGEKGPSAPSIAWADPTPDTISNGYIDEKTEFKIGAASPRTLGLDYDVWKVNIDF